MAMTIPVLNPMPAGYVAQVADMNAISQACTFLLNKPLTKVIDTVGGQALATTASTLITFSSVVFDLDGMWSASKPKQLTIQTPGFYKVRAGVNTNGISHNCWLQSVTGANNPAGSGVASGGNWVGYSLGNSTAMSGVSGIWPVYLYALDYVQLYAYPNSVASQALNNGGSYLALELVSV